MWELDYKESWAPKNGRFWTVILEKTFESFLDCKIQPVHPKGNQSWIFIGKTDAEAKTLILFPPDVKNWLIGKDLDARKDWRWEEKGMTEDQMVSLTQWTWVWVNSGSWWWTGRPGVLQSMKSQRVGHGWATELNFCGSVWRALLWFCVTCTEWFCVTCTEWFCVMGNEWFCVTGTSVVLCDVHWVVKRLSHPVNTSPSEVRQGDTWPSHFRAYTTNESFS